MEKTLEILEKNVQWIVLGLAALFLGWVAYTYVVKPPAIVKLGNKLVVAADIDPKIHDGPVTQLQTAIKSTEQVAFAAPDLVTPWQEHMQGPIGVALGPIWDVLPPKGGPIIDDGPRNKIHITSLPQLAKADVVGSVAGMSVVQPQNPAANAAGANPGPQNVAANKDLLWVTSFGTISGKLLTQALLAPLKDQHIDHATFDNIYNTTLLEVTLQRQQSIGINAQGGPQFPNSEKGIETVAPLTIYLATLQPLPSEKADTKDKYDYLTWAQQNGQLIATPAFYPVVAGTPWAPPPNPANAPAGGPATAPGDKTTQPAGAPAAPPDAPASPPAAGNTKASFTAPGRSNATFAPFDASRPEGSAFPGGDPRFREGAGGGFPPGGFPPGGAPFNPGANGNPNAAVAGLISPFAPIADIQIWGHDENVKTGQTYRYRFIYKMKNPVFAIQNQAAANIINIFSIVSPPSDWTAAVTVPDTTKFWLSQIARIDLGAKMDVFRWENGQWTVRKNVNVSPGDTIPGTAVTVVDIRTADPRGQKDKYVLLVGDSGDLRQRNLNDDVNDPEHQTMLTQAGANTPVAPVGPAKAPIRRPPLPTRTQSLLPSR
jgi:hypothetical protein